MHRFAAPVTHPAHVLALAGLLTLGATAAQAQSSYTLTTIKASNSLAILPTQLDEQGNVLGTARYYNNIGLLAFGASGIPLFGGFGMIYDHAPSRWAAGTTASVTPKRIGTFTGYLTAASPDGKLVMVANRLLDGSKGQVLVDYTRLGQAGNASIDTLRTVAPHTIANDGTVLFDYSLGLQNGAGLWQGGPLGGKALSALELAPTGRALVNASTVVGGIGEGTPQLQRAALWRQGQLTVLDQRPGRGSVALRGNEAGQVLMATMTATEGSTDIDATTTYRYYSYTNWQQWVRQPDGQELAVQPLQTGHIVNAQAMNASGTVVGRSGARSPNAYLTPSPRAGVMADDINSRAIIWRDGVTTDLNAWVAGKGLKLPTGSVLTDAYDINDQGTILAVMRASNGQASYVRLNAKP